MAKKTSVIENPAEFLNPHLLINLPPETLVLIFEYVGNILPVVNTCKFFKNIALENKSLSHKLDFISKPNKIAENIQNLRAMATTSNGSTLAIATLKNREIKLNLIDNSSKKPKFISLQSCSQPSIPEKYYNVTLTFTAQDKYLIANYHKEGRSDEPEDKFIIIWDVQVLKEVGYWSLNQSSKNDFLAKYVDSAGSTPCHVIRNKEIKTFITIYNPSHIIHLKNTPHTIFYSTNYNTVFYNTKLSNPNLYFYNNITSKLTEVEIEGQIQNQIVSSDGSTFYFSLTANKTDGLTEIQCIQFKSHQNTLKLTDMDIDELNNNNSPSILQL